VRHSLDTVRTLDGSAHEWSADARTGEGVQGRDPGGLDVARVPGDERQSMDQSCGSKESIDRGQRIRDVERAPAVGDRGVDRKDPLLQSPVQAEEPLSESFCLVSIASADRLDASPDLTDDQDAGEQVGVRRSLVPGADTSVAPITLPDL
jgi:hypothetical protein